MRKPLRAKPCPFCGSSDVFVENMDAGVYRMWCNECAALGPPVERGDYGDGRNLEEHDATRAWNQRKHPVLSASTALASKEEVGRG
jgi:Lar family restriction alleviation protein